MSDITMKKQDTFFFTGKVAFLQKFVFSTTFFVL